MTVAPGTRPTMCPVADVDPLLRKAFELGQATLERGGLPPPVETVTGPKNAPVHSALKAGVVERVFTDAAANRGSDGNRLFDYSVRLRATHGSKDTPTPNYFTAWRPSVAEPTQAELFGTPTPANDVCLVQRFASPHPVDPNKPPILLAAGTGDNPIRAFPAAAKDFAAQGFPVYFFTANNPNNAAPVVAEQLSVAARFIAGQHDGTLPIFDGHSAANGAFEVLVRLNQPGFKEELARRGVFVPSTPLPPGKVKILHRGHPGLGEDLAHAYSGLVAGSLVPPFATNASGFSTWGLRDLRSVDTLPNNARADVFPGSSSLLARQSRLPPAVTAALDAALHPFDLTRAAAAGALALQPNWAVAYEGGPGFFAFSRGVDAAAKDGGNLIELFQEFPTRGEDVERHVVFGTNPYNFNGSRLLLEERLGETVVDRFTAPLDYAASAWAYSPWGLGAALALQVSLPQLQGMLAGQFVAGDLRGGRFGSDGVVSAKSARGVETLGEVENLVELDVAHLDLLRLDNASAERAERVYAENPVRNAWAKEVARRSRSFNVAEYMAKHMVD